MSLSVLKGKRVVITRAAEQAGELSDLLRKEGAVPIEVPVIAMSPPEFWTEVDRAIKKLDQYRLLILTSQNGVRFFFERLRQKGVRRLSPELEVAAIGEKTARALRSAGVERLFVPEEAAAAEELIELLTERYRSLKGLKVLFPRAERGREALPSFLQREGAEVDLVTVYRTEAVRKSGNQLRKMLSERTVDWVTFASASAVEAFFGLGEGESWPGLIRSAGIRIAAIGRITAEAVRTRGLSVDAEPRRATIEAMVEAMKGVG